jgi:hypothetical protein
MKFIKKESLAYVNIRGNIFRAFLLNKVYQQQCSELHISFGKVHNKGFTLLILKPVPTVAKRMYSFLFAM